MDGDPAVEPVIDGFSRVLPLPYRVALIIVLGTPPTLLTPFHQLTATPRHMGMGSQPPLPDPHKNRRPIPNPLPGPRLPTPPPAPSLLLPDRNLPLHPTCPLPVPFLEPHARLAERHRRLGNHTKPLPAHPRNNLRRAAPVRLAHRPLPHVSHTQEDIHRWYR